MAVEKSQQMPFIDTYNRSRQDQMEYLKQKQEMNRIMQQMQLEREMHPLEMRGKQAVSGYNEALTDESMDRVDISRHQQTQPNYNDSVKAGLQSTIEKAGIDKIDRMSKDNQYNVDLDSSMAMQKFFSDPTLLNAIATNPGLRLQYEQIKKQIETAKINNQGTRSSNPNEWVLLEEALKTQAKAEGWSPQKYAEEMRKIITIKTTREGSPFPELPDKERTVIRGDESTGEMERIVIPD